MSARSISDVSSGIASLDLRIARVRSSVALPASMTTVWDSESLERTDVGPRPWKPRCPIGIKHCRSLQSSRSVSSLLGATEPRWRPVKDLVEQKVFLSKFRSERNLDHCRDNLHTHRRCRVIGSDAGSIGLRPRSVQPRIIFEKRSNTIDGRSGAG
jgi:hypothetical protein